VDHTAVSGPTIKPLFDETSKKAPPEQNVYLLVLTSVGMGGSVQ